MAKSRGPGGQCELCQVELPKQMVIRRPTRVYRSEVKQTLVRQVCDSCWHRHQGFKTTADRKFRLEHSFDEWCAALTDSDRSVRDKAAWALARFGDPRAVTFLHDALEQEVTGQLLLALADLGGPEAEAELLFQFQRPEVWYHRPAETIKDSGHYGSIVPGLMCEALITVGGPTLLLRALLDTNNVGRLAGILRNWQAGLGMTEWDSTWCEITDAHRELVFEPLRTALADERWTIRESAAEALGWLGDERAFPDLVALLEDDEYQVRAGTARVLGRMGDQRALPHLISLLGDHDHEVRYRVVQALGDLGDHRAIRPVRQALKSHAVSTPEARTAAKTALWRLRLGRWYR